MKTKPQKSVSEVKEKVNVFKKRFEIWLSVYFKCRSLSKEEKKRLYKLKQLNEKVAKEQVEINTAQKSLPFVKMYEDGICQVTDTFFARIVEFEDINYELLEYEERTVLLEEYAKFINSFDPTTRFELFFFNRKVSEKKLKERFKIASQGDDFDDIREEFEEILKNQAAKGNNGIVKSKYIIFGKDFDSYEDAKKLENISKDVVRNLNNMGANARRLDGKEWLSLL